MSAHALSPRPIDFLPPTLQPHAIASSAPGTDRRLSFLVACLVYTSVAAVLAVAARNAHDARASWIPPTNTVTVIPDDSNVKSIDPPPPPAMTHAVAPTQTRPVDWVPKALITQDTPPDEPPPNLPRDDRRLDGIYRPDMPIGDGKIVNSGFPTTTENPGVEGAPQIIDLEPSAVKVLYQVQPNYPPLARYARIQGAVVLRMTIDAQGIPTDVRVISSPHTALEGESLRVAHLWRFQPARLDGRPIAAKFNLTLNYRLTQ